MYFNFTKIYFLFEKKQQIKIIGNLFILFIYVSQFSDQSKVYLMIVFTKLQKLLTKTWRMIPPCLVKLSFERLNWLKWEVLISIFQLCFLAKMQWDVLSRIILFTSTREKNDMFFTTFSQLFLFTFISLFNVGTIVANGNTNQYKKKQVPYSFTQ